MCLLSDLLVLGLSLKLILSNFVVYLTLDLFGVLSTFLSELCLEISEQRLGSNFDINDLTSFEPDTPTSDDFLHFLLDSISELRSILQDIIDGHVCDSVSDDRDGHVL